MRKIFGEVSMKLSKHEIQKLEDYWMNLDEYKIKLRHRERDLIDAWQETDSNIGGGKSVHISDVTGNKATILADDVMYQNLKRIVNTIETMLNELDEDQEVIVQMKYLAKQEAYEWQHIADQLGMSVQRVLRKRNNLIDETAKRLGWV